jgi:hypothetical protein
MRRILLSLAGACVVHAGAVAACPPQGMSRTQLTELRSAKWEVPDNARRQLLAGAMLDCLADPDPVLRDDHGFEALQTWMRTQKLDVATMQTMRATLMARLRAPDPTGFAAPFAALALAEVVRADRIKPFMSDKERADLASFGSTYLFAVRDYRGFDEKEGWRHGVAHGADMMVQLAVHPGVSKADHQAILAAVAAQLATPSSMTPPHFYRYGEGERLMAPVFYLARKDTFSAAEWEAWFGALIPAAAPQSQAVLARRHNLKSFLMPLYASLAESKDEAQRARILPFVTKALKQLD